MKLKTHQLTLKHILWESRTSSRNTCLYRFKGKLARA